MRRSLIWSATLHVLVLVLALVGLPHLWNDAVPTEHPVIIEVVKVDEKTTAKDVAKPEPKRKPPKKQAPPPPKPKPATAEVPPPPAIADIPEPKAEKVPVKPQPKKIKKKKEPEKKKPEAKSAPPKSIARVRPRRRPLPPKEDFLQSVLRDVAPEERSPTPREKPAKAEPAPQPEKQVTRRAALDAVVTTSEIDAIRHKVEQCWVIPAGARDVDKLVVSIRVWVNPDGTVRQAVILDRNRMSKDQFFRTAAESALRAVLNPRCSPLPIPPKKYEQFKELVLDFNPKQATGS